MNVDQLLNYALSHQASDLHLSSGVVPKIRVDGDLQDIPDQPLLDPSALMEAVKQLTPTDKQESMQTTLEADFSYEISGGTRFRVNVFFQARGVSVVFRVIPAEVIGFDQLGLPEVMRRLCDLPKGLVLVTGPTGSGKSTTLAAMIDYINAHKKLHVLTLEDPIEFSHQSKQCLIQQREIGAHTRSFNNALRAALREDPDVILVGEMRDMETVRLALTAAETGHLVFATLHTSSAAKTINRIIDVFPAGEKSMVRSMLSESLQAVIAQVLVKRAEGGRVAAHEIMVCTPAIRNLIREDKVPQIVSALQTGVGLGMSTLERSLTELVDSGVVNQADVMEYLQKEGASE